MKCGLLGETLGHSFSPQIHARLADYSYTLMPMPPAEVGPFLKQGDFDGLNVTIPYKQTVIPFCDFLSPEAERIGAVNTLVRRNGKLLGYNTDIYGFLYMVRRAGIDFAGKKVLILGTGGPSHTAAEAARQLGAGEIVTVSRTGPVNYENVYDLHEDAGILVNTTPVGMYPNNGVSPIELDRLPTLSGVVDVVYNPLKTTLILESERRSIPCTGGLVMLVAQAKKSAEHFLGRAISEKAIERIYKDLLRQQRNIVLIGMPGCGKTTVGRRVAATLERPFVDIDAEIVRTAGRDIPTIFAEDGEEGFRRLETEVLRRMCMEPGQVIATGGGCVTRAENYLPIRENGLVVFIKRPLDKLSRRGRPLSQGADLGAMYAVRKPLYEQFADRTVRSRFNVADTVRRVLEVTK